VVGGAARPGSRRGLPPGVTVFAYPDNFVTKSKILHNITNAKTRATATLRQLHIPPNVRANENTGQKYFFDIRLLIS